MFKARATREADARRAAGTRVQSLHVRLEPCVGMAYRFRTMKRRAQSQPVCCPPANAKADLRPIEGVKADAELAALAKAIGHPARVQILRILVRRITCVCGDIVDELPLAQSTVSQHLKILKGVGLIRGEVDGPRTCYCVEPRTLRRLRALVGGL